jgi:hypothetical protein
MQQLTNRFEVVSVLRGNKLGEQRLHLILAASAGYSGDTQQHE